MFRSIQVLQNRPVLQNLQNSPVLQVLLKFQPGRVGHFQCPGRKRLHAGWLCLQNLHLMMTRLIVMLHNLKPGRVGSFQCPGRNRLFKQECQPHAGRIFFRLGLECYLLPITEPTIPYQEDLTLNLRITIFSPPLLATNFQKTWVD